MVGSAVGSPLGRMGVGKSLSRLPGSGIRDAGPRRAGFLALALALASPIPPALGQTTPTTAYTSASVRLRAEPSATSTVVAACGPPGREVVGEKRFVTSQFCPRAEALGY